MVLELVLKARYPRRVPASGTGDEREAMIDTRRRFLSAIPLSLLLTLGSAGSERAVAQDAPRIVAEELKRLVGKGEAVIVDVRSQSAWDVSHIDGALHIPLAELSSRLKELPKDKLIACYCT